MIKLLGFTQGFVLWFIVYFFIRLPLIILGFGIVPLAYVFRKAGRFPKWAWIWDNEEDGIWGAYWFNKGAYNFKTCFLWSAVRNPVNNMRFIPGLSLNRDKGIRKAFVFGNEDIPTPSIARVVGGYIWHLTLVQQHFIYYPSFWLIKAKSYDKHFRIRIGWKCTPKWINDERLSETGKFSGITFQLMPDRDG